MTQLITFCLSMLLLASVALAQDQEESNRIVQGKHSYTLALRDGSLSLAAKHTDEQSVKFRQIQFDIPKNGRITEMRLEPWYGEGGLCAVVEVSVDDKYQYSSITLWAEGPSAGYAGGSALFHTSSVNHRILALNGTFRGDSVVALLGVVQLKDDIARAVESGVIYLDDCPQPPSRGSISRFTAEPELDPMLLELLGVPSRK